MLQNYNSTLILLDTKGEASAESYAEGNPKQSNVNFDNSDLDDEIPF